MRWGGGGKGKEKEEEKEKEQHWMPRMEKCNAGQIT